MAKKTENNLPQSIDNQLGNICKSNELNEFPTTRKIRAVRAAYNTISQIFHMHFVKQNTKKI